MAKVELREIKREVVTFRIKGITPLITHQWSEKAKEMMREKHAGKKTKTREIRDTKAEAMAAAYRTQKGEYGIPAMALKSAIVNAAHKDIGFEKTLVRKSIFIACDDAGLVLPIVFDGTEPIVREDAVTVGMGSTDLRYRPEFRNWSAIVSFEIDAELLTHKDLIALVNRAGFGVGICEWRPERGGEFGRFQVDSSFPLEVS